MEHGGGPDGAAVLSIVALPAALLALAVAAGVGAIGRTYRARVASRMEAASLARFPLGSDGILRGADAITLERLNAPAVLLLHGAGDTPASLRYLAAALHGAGYAVHAPLLPGHGRVLRELAVVTAEQWFDAAAAALARLFAGHAWVAVAGLSMGGALAARLAADDRFSGRLSAVVLLAPYLVPPRRVRFAAGTGFAWGLLLPYLDTTDPRSIHDDEERARALGHGVMTPAALRALVRTAVAAHAVLPRVCAPTLVVLSRQDNRVASVPARRAFERIGARDRQLVWRGVGGHILPVDRGREEVFATILDWLAAHGGVRRREDPAASDAFPT